VDRSLYKYASDIYLCPRETCKGVKNQSDVCWQYSTYESILNGSKELTSKKCVDADLLCTVGAYGPLCGSCDVGYVYRGETKSCAACGNAKKFAFTMIGLISGVLLLGVVLVIAHRHQMVSFERLHLESFDSGSLKVRLINTYICV
jgi:hypothetical protein